jgi:two-component system response regulator GlrR
LDDSFFKSRRRLEQGMVPPLGPIDSPLADELTLTPTPAAMTSGPAAQPSVCATFGRLVGQSARMRKVIDQLKVVAPQNTTLLLEGESGTGKELAAEAVHAASQCRKGPFVVVDCAAVPRNLIEAELFGHEKGAFTGAVQSREGAFVKADGGTVFLDEIGELELDIQPRLLRVIETRAIKPVGGSVPRRLNVRIIAATNRDLSREAEQGRFRTDLYYRLAVTRVRMPSLEERREDVPLLCHYVIEDLCERDRKEYVLEPKQVADLARRRWPGNVRELRNAIERLTVLGIDDGEEDEKTPSSFTPTPTSDRHFRVAKAEAIASFERQFLTELMAEHRGNITAAAIAAHVDRVHFLRLLDRHGLRKPRRI